MRPAKDLQETLEGEMQYIQEEVEGLAEDVVELDEKVDGTLDVMKGICKNGMAMCDVMRDLDKKIDDVDNIGWKFFLFLVIWNFVLTGILVYNAF